MLLRGNAYESHKTGTRNQKLGTIYYEMPWTGQPLLEW